MDRERVQPEHCVLHHLGDNSVWEFIERKEVACASESFSHHLDLLFNLRNMFIGGGSVEDQFILL